MKILAFTDVHGSEKAMKSIENMAKKCDFCVCSGDISMFEQRLEALIRRLNSFKKQVFIIPGNHEGQQTLRGVCRRYSFVRDVHGEIVNFGEFAIIGFGTSGFSLIDESFENFVRRKVKRTSRKIIFLSHAPPYNTKLDRLGNSHAGNKSVAGFIRKYKPDYVVCGHLHENFGKKDVMGGTAIINPGPFGAIIDITEDQSN